MKTKTPVSIKKQSVTVKDLPTKKNLKGGIINTTRSNIKRPGISDQGAVGGLISY